MARNGLGPTVTGTIALCLGQGGCTLTSLDLSDNPLGYSAKNGGIARDAGLDLKIGLRTSSTLAFLDLSQSTLQPSEMVCFIECIFSRTRESCIISNKCTFPNAP